LAPVPLIKSIQKLNPKKQTNFRALITNQWQSVRGVNDIYAIGECSTVDQAHILKQWQHIFDDLDENRDGTIDEREFKLLEQRYARRYPQLLGYSDAASSELFKSSDANKDNVLSRDEFQDLLVKVDSTLTSFPSTAQTAYQQGRYLASSLNMVMKESEVKRLFKTLDEDGSGFLEVKEIRRGLRKLGLRYTKEEVQGFIQLSDANHDNKLDEAEFMSLVLDKQQQGKMGDWKKMSHSRISPFRYKHLGGFEYVGYTEEITQRGSQSTNVLDGYGAWWLWNSIHGSKLLGFPVKSRQVLDLGGAALFGPNMSKNHNLSSDRHLTPRQPQQNKQL